MFCLFAVVLPKTTSVPNGFNKLKPFWVSEPPSGSRTMSTPAERQDKTRERIGLKDECEELFMSLYQLDIQGNKNEKKNRNNVKMQHENMNFPCQERRVRIFVFCVHYKKLPVCFLTLRADFAYFLHVVFGAVVNGVGYPTLRNGLVFGG